MNDDEMNDDEMNDDEMADDEMTDDATSGVWLDLSAVASSADIHAAIARALEWPADVATSWSGFWDCISGERPLPEAIVVQGLDHVEATLPDDAKRFIELVSEYNNVPDGPRCVLGVSDDYRCSMYFVLFEAVPTAEAEFGDDAKGAMICCWIKTDSAREAHRIAREHIAESGWMIVQQEEIHPAVREDYDEDSSGLPYYEQACVDGMTFVFHTWSSDEDDAEGDIAPRSS